MKRSSSRVGKRGTWPGGSTPLHAICKVIQTGFPFAAPTIFLVTSPTTLTSLFWVAACRPGGYPTG